MYWYSFLVFILLTIVFLVAVSENSDQMNCPYPGGKCYNGNGKHQYKGRGSNKDSVSTLLSRIDWIGKKGAQYNGYAISFMTAYIILIGIMLVMYGCSEYMLSPWEIIVLILAIYLILFSIGNFMDFHGHRYPMYYLRNNSNLIAKKLGLKLKTKVSKPTCSGVPHRTIVRDVLVKN